MPLSPKLILLLLQQEEVAVTEAAEKGVAKVTPRGYRCINCNLNTQDHITEKARQVYQKSQQGPHPATAEDVANGKFDKKNS